MSLITWSYSSAAFANPKHATSMLFGKLKFQITNQQITIQTKFSGLKIEDIPKICSNVQQNLLHPIFQFKSS
jgi:hypothetical protein